MTKETLKEEIQLLVPRLIEMAKDLCWNKLSENLVYIVSEIPNTTAGFKNEAKIRKKLNDKMIPMSYDQAINQLLPLYDNLYDINLYIYKANKNNTIIDIRYYPKSSLIQEHQQTAENSPPMLHCKVAIPPYKKNEKFDVNWEHGGLRHKWNKYWGRKRMRKEIERLSNSG